MKTINAYLSVAMATLSLTLTSCLGNGKNEISLPQQAFVVEYEPTTFMKVARIQGGTLLTSTELNNQPGLTDGSCGLVDITVNFDDQPQGAKALTAIMSNWIEADRQTLYNGDSTGTGGYNKTMANAMAYQYIQTESKSDLLFVVASNRDPKGQVNSYELTFDPSSTGEEIGGRTVYNMYLRSRVKTSGENSSILEEKGSVTAFNITSFMRSKGDELQAKGQELIGLRLLYLNKVDTLDNNELVYKFINPSNVQPAYIPLPKKEDK